MQHRGISAQVASSMSFRMRTGAAIHVTVGAGSGYSVGDVHLQGAAESSRRRLGGNPGDVPRSVRRWEVEMVGVEAGGSTEQLPGGNG